MAFKEYRLGAAMVGGALGFSMIITMFMPSFDLRSAVSTRVALEKQLSAGYDVGFMYADPLLLGVNRPLTVILDKDPKTGAPLDPPVTAYVYQSGVPMPPNVRHPHDLGKGVEDLSMGKGQMGSVSGSNHSAASAQGVVFTIGVDEFNGEELSYIENASALRGWTPEATLAAAGDKNTRYISKGKTEFVAQGCWWCHTLLPEQTQDWQAFGAPPYLGDFNGETPTAFGSDRKAPDLLHVASRNGSREWMMMHFFNPRLVQVNSIMPRYDYLWGDKDVNGNTIDFDKWRAEYREYAEGKRTYPPEVPDYAPNSEIRALIDWVLSLK